MKVRIIRPFRDKHTEENYTKGQIITVAKERFEEMNSTALGVVAEEIREPKKPRKKTSNK